MRSSVNKKIKVSPSAPGPVRKAGARSKGAPAKATREKAFFIPEEIRRLIQHGQPSVMPEYAKPMMATLVKESFDDAGWLFELKWDGYRAVGSVFNGKVDLLSRNNISFKAKFFPVAEALQRWNINVVVDGEIITLNEKGVSDFQQLQSWQRTGKGELLYYVFDILWADGYSLTGLGLTERKKILEALVPENDIIRYSDHILEHGKAFFALALEQGLEGVMAKKADSDYHPGVRSRQWLKIKTHQAQEAVIAGFTEGRGGRKHFGALILGMYQNNEFVYIGHTGSGLDDKGLIDVYNRLKPLITPVCPFTKKPKTNMSPTWVKPSIVCEVKFQEWTKDNILRIPIFLRLREDKKANEITKEGSVDPAVLTRKQSNPSKKAGPDNEPMIPPVASSKQPRVRGKKKPE